MICPFCEIHSHSFINTFLSSAFALSKCSSFSLCCYSPFLGVAVDAESAADAAKCLSASAPIAGGGSC